MSKHSARSDTSNSQKKGRNPPVAPTPEKQVEFLALLREGRTVEGAARNVGIHRSTLYRLRDRNEEFRRSWDEAWEAGIEALEDELRRRGFEGVEKPVFHSGVVVGSVREFDTTAAIFILKARKPEVYRDNARIEHTGPGGGPSRSRASARSSFAGSSALPSGVVSLASLSPADRQRLYPRTETQAKALLYDWPLWARNSCRPRTIRATRQTRGGSG